MSKRLNDLLIGKIRHNLKTHLNIVCGFSELLLEELEDIAEGSNDEGLEALASINQSGDSIVQYIDQMFAAHNFSLEDVFSQLNVQAQAFRDCTNEFVSQINERLAWCEANTPEEFFAEFEEDFRKIERATLALQDNVITVSYTHLTLPTKA